VWLASVHEEKRATWPALPELSFSRTSPARSWSLPIHSATPCGTNVSVVREAPRFQAIETYPEQSVR
jgi:hypothetical protein